MVRKKREFRVVDAKSGEDITHNVLTQIIMEEEARGTTMLPVNFLRQLIGMYGDSMQAMVPQYLEASLDQFQRNQSQFRDAISGALTGGPFADIAKRNLELFTSAAGVAPKPASAEPDAAQLGEVEELKRELAELKAKVDKLAG
jgi:polyhydroxyalkanoate synthesis repressor PhaR